MNQSWFEMNDIRTKKFAKTVWIPIRALQTLTESGKYAYHGYVEEFFGCGSIAVKIEDKDKALELRWSDVGSSSDNRGYYDNGEYTPADVFTSFSDISAIHLVLDQHINSVDKREWHLSQDFVTTLGLLREGDIWVSPNEGYIEVAKLTRNKDGEACLMEVRAEHLKDYLCARNMGLYISSYYSRAAVVKDGSFLSWIDDDIEEVKNAVRWSGRTMEIHEGNGEHFGSHASVMHVGRTSTDGSDDIPNISELPTNENSVTSTWDKTFDGRKLFRIDGEVWADEWINPAKLSPRIKYDEPTPTIFFIVDEEGTKENRETLKRGGKWLWFKPDVIMALSHRRGGSLGWYTAQTGDVRCSPDNRIHFGINSIGLVNVYAKDIALLPEWQQQIWSGYNISPEGGVSDELSASQVHAVPVSTQAPEAYLFQGIDKLNELSQKNLGITLFREHEYITELKSKIHRFRAIDDAGLYALAKDIARITADSLNVSDIQSVVAPPDKKFGSLKSLEVLIASQVEKEVARNIMSPLVGAYELRLADAHLPKSTIDEAFILLSIDRSKPIVFQAYQMLSVCVTSLYTIIKILDSWKVKEEK